MPSEPGEKKLAYVLNPSLKKEFKTLRASGIFELTNDSSDTSAIRIRLYPLEEGIMFLCLMPMTPFLATFGQLPFKNESVWRYRFDEIHKDHLVTNEFEIKLIKKYWFWNMFAVDKNFDKKAGRILYYNYNFKR